MILPYILLSRKIDPFHDILLSFPPRNDPFFSFLRTCKKDRKAPFSAVFRTLMRIQYISEWGYGGFNGRMIESVFGIVGSIQPFWPNTILLLKGAVVSIF